MALITASDAGVTASSVAVSSHVVVVADHSDVWIMKSVPTYIRFIIFHTHNLQSDGSLPFISFMSFTHNESISIVHAQVLATSVRNDTIIPVVYAVSVGVIVTTYESVPTALAPAYK